MRPPRLVEPEPGDLRLLAPSALRLWRALVRARDRAEGPDEWFLADLHDLKRWAAIGSYATAKAALASLRRAGLVATSRTHSCRWVRSRETGRLDTVNALEQHLYLVAGTLRTRSGIDKLEFPLRPWRQFVTRCATVARRSMARVEAWRRDLPRVEWRKEWTDEVMADLRGSQRPHPHLGAKPSTSVNYSTKRFVVGETSKKAAGAAVSPTFDPVEIELVEDQDPDEARSVGTLSLTSTGTPLVPRPGRCPSLPPDTFPRPPPTVMYISPEQVPENKARYVVDSYRIAVREVYGVEWWHYSKGDIKRARYYDRLVKAGEAFAEHSIAPDHWAIWRLRWFKDHAARFANTPPPVFVVMSAKTVSEKAGWFRKDYDLPLPVFKPDPIITEQHLRNLEARRRWQGVPEHAVFWFHFPGWYVDKRQQEIADGCDSPHTMWPTKPGSKYGRTHS